MLSRLIGRSQIWKPLRIRRCESTTLNVQLAENAMNLSPVEMRDFLRDNVKSLKSEELVSCVRALDNWPELKIHLQTRRSTDVIPEILAGVEDEAEAAQLEVAQELMKESVYRLWRRGDSNVDTYINDKRVLCDLCTAWQERKSRRHCIHRSLTCVRTWQCITAVEQWNSMATFTASVLLKWGDKTRSRSLFKDIKPDVFVDLMSLSLRQRRLSEDFHRYYAIYKFHELMDHFSLEDVDVILKAFSKHDIVLTKEHPMNLLILSQVYKKLEKEANRATSKNVKHTLSFIMRKSPTKAPEECDASTEEEMIATDLIGSDRPNLPALATRLQSAFDTRLHNFDVDDVAKLLILNREAAPPEDLRQRLLTDAASADTNALPIDVAKPLVNMLRLAWLQDDAELQAALKSLVVKSLVEDVTCKSSSTGGSKHAAAFSVLFTLAMDNFFVWEAIAELFSKQHVFPKGRLAPTIYYDRNGLMMLHVFKVGYVLAAAEIELGDRYSADWPTVASALPAHNRLPSGHRVTQLWTNVRKDILERLEDQLGGAQFIHECLVLPNLGASSFVFAIDGSGKAVEFPDSYKNSAGVKWAPASKDREYFVIFLSDWYVTRDFHYMKEILEKPLEGLVMKLGYAGHVVIDSEALPEGMERVDAMLKRAVANK